MARAKRTDRADARRRFRVAQAEAMEPGEFEDEEPEEPVRGQRPPAATRAGGQSAPRPSFFSAFSAAARPFNIRDDLRYLPTLIVRTRAVWVPALLTVASGIAFVAFQPIGSNGIANFLLQVFVLPPTIGGAFLAGILAPRATYLAGGIAALIGAIVFALVVLVVPPNAYTTATTGTAAASPSASAVASAEPSASAAPGSSSGTEVPFDRTSTILQAIVISVPFGLAIGGFGGYYKRFLFLSNPARQRRALQQQRERQQGRGNAKKRY